MSRTTKAANTRAEQIRQRRNHKSDSRQENVRRGGRNKTQMRSKYYEVSVPPVVVRGNVTTPMRQRTITRKRQRRQVAIPLRGSGAEIVIPGLPVIHFNARWISGALTIAFLVLLLFVVSSGTFEVTQAEITGMHRINADDVERVLNVSNESIFNINPNEIQQKLETAFPELKNIQVSVNLPAEIAITAEERQPVIAWHSGDTVYWSDEEGVLFDPRGEERDLLVINIDGEMPFEAIETSLTEETDVLAFEYLTANPRKVDRAALSTAQKLAREVEAGTALAYSQENGLGWINATGCEVFVGMNTINMQEKMVVYKAILEALNLAGLTPSKISVANVDAPFYRLEQ
jgi:cell division septal protein FtsQ